MDFHYSVTDGKYTLTVFGLTENVWIEKGHDILWRGTLADLGKQFDTDVPVTASALFQPEAVTA